MNCGKREWGEQFPQSVLQGLELKPPFGHLAALLKRLRKNSGFWGEMGGEHPSEMNGGAAPYPYDAR
jgi:hypothetical protein